MGVIWALPNGRDSSTKTTLLPYTKQRREFFAELFTITPIGVHWKLAFICFHSQCQKKQASITYVQGI